jgi:NADH-quinone oxidoreductase subunit M
MTTSPLPWLTLIVFWPLAATLGLPLAQGRAAGRVLALGATLMELGLAVAVTALYAGPGPGPLLTEQAAWLPGLGIHYLLVLDGLSLPFVILTAGIGVCCVLAAWRLPRERPALHHALVLASLATVQGIFLAGDLFLFMLFWEAQIIPVFFLIGLFGHGDRVRSALKFFLFSATGGLLLFLAVIALGLLSAQAGAGPDFSLTALARLHLPPATAGWLFAAFLAAFAIKIPLPPVHTWLPDAHTDAPTAGSLILAGLLLKTGGYGLIRLAMPLFPEASGAAAPLLIGLGLFGLFFASLVALAQEDVKRLIAYSSIGHMGLAVVGLASGNRLALAGAVILMLSHGLTTGALFALAGMIGDRLGSRRLDILGGLWNRAPGFGAAFLLAVLASAALPGLSGFVGEAMIVFGLFAVHPVAGVLALCGMVATLVYLLRLARDVLFGPSGSALPFPGLDVPESLLVAGLSLAMLVLGLFPDLVLGILTGPLGLIADRLAPALAVWPGP